MTPDGVDRPAALRLVAAERREVQRVIEGTELVWSGPEGAQSASRDTGVVVRELFRQARRSVLLANYAFDRGSRGAEAGRARTSLEPLAQNLDANPGLQVRFFVNVARPGGGSRVQMTRRTCCCGPSRRASGGMCGRGRGGRPFVQAPWQHAQTTTAINRLR